MNYCAGEFKAKDGKHNDESQLDLMHIHPAPPNISRHFALIANFSARANSRMR